MSFVMRSFNRFYSDLCFVHNNSVFFSTIFPSTSKKKITIWKFKVLVGHRGDENCSVLSSLKEINRRNTCVNDFDNCQVKVFILVFNYFSFN